MVNHHALRTRNAPRVGRCAQARGQAPFPHAGGAISIDGPHTSVSHRQRRGCRRRACAAFPRAIRGHLPADRTGNPVAAGRPAGPDVAGSQRRRKRRRRAAHRPARHRPGEGARPGGRRGVRPPTRAARRSQRRAGAPTASGRSCWDSSPANLRCLPGWRAYREGTTLSARRRRLWLRTTRSAQPNWRSSTSQGTRRTAALRAVSLTSAVTQRDPVDPCSPMPAADSALRDRPGNRRRARCPSTTRGSVPVAGGQILLGLTRAVCGMSALTGRSGLGRSYGQFGRRFGV